MRFEKARILSFSDGVFSVAMTLLILEVAIPTYQDFNSLSIQSLLLKRIPNFIGFSLSFLVSAFYWIDYLKISKYVSSFDLKALWMNILILFLVVILPFSTAFYVNGITLKGPFAFYAFNLASIALAIYFFIVHVHQKEEGKTGLTKLNSSWQKMKILNTFFVWLMAGIIGLFFPIVANFFFILMFLIDYLIDRHYKKRFA